LILFRSLCPGVRTWIQAKPEKREEDTGEAKNKSHYDAWIENAGLGSKGFSHGVFLCQAGLGRRYSEAFCGEV
jgi:hypothetical protein